MRDFKISKRTGCTSRFNTLLIPTRISYTQDQILLSPPAPPLLSREIETQGSRLADDFQRLLNRWNAPSTTVSSFLKHHHFEEWERRSNLKQAPILFQLIEDLVHKEEERFELMKIFLDEDLASQSRSNYPYSKWHQCWNEILKRKNWYDAKEFLLENECCSAIMQAAGNTFICAALVVIAEQLLLVCKAHIEHSEKSRRPLTPCDDDNECLGLTHKRKYLQILRDFRQCKWTVSPFFYRYALEIIDVESLVEKLGKPSSSDVGSSIDHPSHQPHHCPHLNPDSGLYCRSTDKSISHPNNNSGQSTSSPLSTSQAPISGAPTTVIALSALIAKHKTQYFSEYVYSLLIYDGHSLSIFKPSPSPDCQSSNLFSLLASNDSPFNRLPLAVALLRCFSNISPFSSYKPLFLTWLRSLLSSSTWETFTTRLNTPEVSAHLEHIMDDAGRKLVEDAIVLMISERFMLLLRERSRSGKKGASLAKKRGKEGYIEILRALNERGLKVDFCWYNYLYSLW
ncbi:hypothetical protein K3495_g3532 [Podosphaera aphanis]|nr:hypothetical protein K3495_g3532 [Podosphaera aphanis]